MIGVASESNKNASKLHTRGTGDVTRKVRFRNWYYIGSSPLHLLAGILFVSLTALSASWPRREAGRSHQRARCTANPRDVGKDLSHSGQLCGRAGPQLPLPSTLVVVPGYARACPSTWAPTSPSRRMLAIEPLAEASDRRRPRIRACSPSRHTGRGRQCPGQRCRAA